MPGIDYAGRNRKHLDSLLPEVAEVAVRHIAACATEGIALAVVQSLRSMEEQEKIYARGRTMPGRAVTAAKPGYSWHNFGRAYDVAVVEDGRITWNSPKYARAGEVGRALGLIWGGDFKTVKGDVGHFEYHPGLTLAEAREALKQPSPSVPLPQVARGI